MAARDCVGCGEFGVLWCGRCARSLERSPRSVAPTPRPTAFPACWSVGEYAGPLKRAISAYKDRGQRPLALPLGRALADSIQHAVSASSAKQRWIVIPAPSNPKSVQTRGNDTMQGLATHALRELDRRGLLVDLATPLAMNTRVADQSGLSAISRFTNITGSMTLVSGGLEALFDPVTSLPRPIVIVDDVVTTGATLTEAARVLRAVGLTDVRACTIAATRRRFGNADV